MKVFSLLAVSFFLPSSLSNPCDSDWGKHCPESDLAGVSDCLKGVTNLLEDGCVQLMELQAQCSEDIEKGTCPLFSGDTLACLTEWKKEYELTPACFAARPEKVTQEPRKKEPLTQKEKDKLKRRRRTREKAAKMARDQHPQNPKNKRRTSAQDL